ncbi:protein of unknown function [Chryseolinea serpens]|uniref:Uracil-DNA glycosylase-like domain-containing protein n=1 Tax=Chryseolinea serpens TaxID=947013 RepID=A0A1M5RVE2_9BACT|nr:uracil-DNA glycosylase family protein [Chryseolinea serpens]SHH30139.1 protein of unknown function [Chryseolinea serpens]
MTRGRFSFILMTFADNILRFYATLKIKSTLPEGVEILDPYRNKETMALCHLFYHKYYGDEKERTVIIGINPGRNGAGLTGIPFTDPIKLETLCGIPNAFPKKAELSADFIYTMIQAYGGPAAFYKKFFFSAVSPLGFVKDGKNLNYYDIRELQDSLRDYIIASLKKQLTFGINTRIAFCLGEGENFKYISRLNDELKIFKEIIPLAHPRFIMQYKRKLVNEYVEKYLQALSR